MSPGPPVALGQRLAEAASQEEAKAAPASPPPRPRRL